MFSNVRFQIRLKSINHIRVHLPKSCVVNQERNFRLDHVRFCFALASLCAPAPGFCILKLHRDALRFCIRDGLRLGAELLRPVGARPDFRRGTGLRSEEQVWDSN